MKNMKVTYNRNEKHFILRCGEKFPKKVFDTLTYIKEINQPKDNKLIIPHTETNTDILKTLSGFNWSDLAFKKLYDIPVVIEEPKIKVLNHDLFAYQEEGVSFLNQNNGRGILCHEMGLGKTVMALAWCAQEKRRALVVCPASVKYNWEKEIKHWLKFNKKAFILNGRKSEDIPKNLDYMIINYDIIAFRGNDIVDFDPDVIILDECFPEGTLINTPKGKIPIEQIKEGDEVYNAIGIGLVRKTISNHNKENLLKIHLNNGKSIICTQNHPFFTIKGWIRGKNLQNADILLDISNIFDIMECNSNLKDIIMEEADEGFKTVRDRRMHKQSKEKPQEVLWERMCSNSQKDSLDTTNDFGNAEAETQREPTKSRGFLKTYEVKQSNEESRSYQEDKRTLEDSRTSHKKTTVKRRKWKRTSLRSKSAVGSTRTRMENRASNIVGKKTGRISNKLQSRYRKSRIKGLDRSRWLVAQSKRQKSLRHKKGKEIKGTRVDRIEILEPRNSEQSTRSTVYNLEVSRHPSYFAEDILVHNCHYIKESKTKRTKAVKLLCKGRDHIIGLSGTPIKSRPLEFFNMLSLINPIMFPSWWKYAQQYCDAKHNRFGWEFKGASNIEELNLLLIGIMIRRLKKDVLKDLPDKIRTTVPIELSNRAKYDRAKKDFLAYTLQEHGLNKAEKASNAEGVVKKGALRRLAIEGKMKGIIDWLKDFLEDNVDEKIILFTIHKQTIKDLMVHFSDVAVVIEGDTPAKERTKIVEKFQNNKKVKVFIGNMMSAGTGITLTASSTVCFLEIDYIPNEFLQAEDRAHRIGQKDSVNVYYFLGKDSIDEEIMIDILNPKMSVFNRVIDGKSESDTNIFETLMEGRDEKTK